MIEIKLKSLKNEQTRPAWAEAALAMPSREGFIDVEGCPVHYIAWGDTASPPMVLIHGNSASAEWWRFIAPLMANEYHVIAPDLGGMGDSPHTGRYDREFYAQQVMSVAAALAPDQKPIVVGHSLGGFVAMLAGTAYGEQLAGLIVLDSPPHNPQTSGSSSPFVQANPVPESTQIAKAPWHASRCCPRRK